MDSKPWYKSKTVWTAIIGSALAAVPPVSAALGHPVVVPDCAYKILSMFGLYAVRDGMGKPIE